MVPITATRNKSLHDFGLGRHLRPIHVRFLNVSGNIFQPLCLNLCVVVQVQLAVDDGKQLALDLGFGAFGDTVGTEPVVLRRILLRIRGKRIAVFGARKVERRAFVSRGVLV
jgi:hypothetical protein